MMTGIEFDDFTILSADTEVSKIRTEQEARSVFDELAALSLSGESITKVSLQGGEHLGGYVVGILIHSDDDSLRDTTWYDFHGTPVAVRKSSHRYTEIHPSQTIQP